MKYIRRLAMILVIALLVSTPVQAYVPETVEIPDDVRRAITEALHERRNKIDLEDYSISSEDWYDILQQIVYEDASLWYVRFDQVIVC